MSTYIISKTGLNEVYIITQESPIAISSYYTIEDSQNGDLVGEVIETNSIPCLNDEYLKEINSNINIAKNTSLDENKVSYIAKIKILKDLIFPITPLSIVRKSKFEEVKPYIYKTDVDKGFNIGVIKGTELMQKELPLQLQNVSPLWENGVAVEQKGVPFVLDFNAQREYPHIFISGGSGSGKSFAFRDIMEELMRYGLPAIAADVHNEFNFDLIMKGLTFNPNFKNKYEIFTVGKDIGVCFSDLTTSELITIISHKESLTDAQKRILERIHTDNMSMIEFETTLNVMASAFGIMDSFKAKETDLDQAELYIYQEYKKYVTSPDTIRSILSKFLTVKNSGIFTKNIEPVKLCLKHSKLAIIRGNLSIVKMLMSFMINRFYNERRHYIDSNIHNPNDPNFFPPFFLFLDEAHNFASKEDSSPLRTLLRKLAQESRKYGVYLVLCTQGSHLLDKTLLDQINTKIFLRTNDIVNKDIAKNEINLNDIQYNMLPNLPSGNGFISSPILSKTFNIQFRTSFTIQPKAEGVFDEILSFNKNMNNSNDLQKEIINWIQTNPKANSITRTQLLANLKNKNFQIDMRNLIDEMEKMNQDNIIQITKTSVGETYSLV